MTQAKLWLLLCAFAAMAACAKLDLSGGGAVPTPSPSITPTVGPTPGACGTPSADANTVLVAMGNLIGPVNVAPYGTLNGYSVVENGEYSGQAMPIDQWLSPAGVAPITTKNSLQFVNVDDTDATHSAVGFKGEAFPSVPYTFPKSAAKPAGSGVSTATLWSTGRIAPFLGSQPCYSGVFGLRSGTFYFGDYDYYNLSNFRDVLIVVTPTPAAEFRTPR